MDSNYLRMPIWVNVYICYFCLFLCNVNFADSASFGVCSILEHEATDYVCTQPNITTAS